jgi:hypothetical protein
MHTVYYTVVQYTSMSIRPFCSRVGAALFFSWKRNQAKGTGRIKFLLTQNGNRGNFFTSKQNNRFHIRIEQETKQKSDTKQKMNTEIAKRRRYITKNLVVFRTKTPYSSKHNHTSYLQKLALVFIT